MRWMRVPTHLLALAAESLAWLLVAFGAMAVIANGQFARELVRGAVDWRRLPHEEHAPRDLLMYSYAAIDSCLASPAASADAGRALYLLHYDPIYHARISKAGFSFRDYPDNPSSNRGELQQLAECISREVFRASELQTWERIEPRILWAYFYIERDHHGIFGGWPAFDIPETFRPWERPWAYDNVLKFNAGSSKVGDISIYSTRPYKDAFTGEAIISLALPIKRDGYKISLAVDVRAGAGPGLYSLSLLFNLFVCVGVAIGSLLIAREFKWRALIAWYRGWLVMSALYGYYTCVFFARGEAPVQEFLRNHTRVAGFVLSSANSIFFCLAGLLLIVSRNERRVIARVWGAAGLLALLAATMEYAFRDSLLSPLDIAEAVIAFASLAVLGSALVVLAWRCGSGHHSTVLRWARPTSGLVVVVFLGYACLQLSIPFFGLWPMVEELFWPAAVLLKVAMVALFFVMILLELYFEKVEVNEIFMQKFPDGILAVDARRRVSNVNDYAIADLGLERAQILGRHLFGVLFASWFEGERFYRELSEKRQVEDFTAIVKRFISAEPLRFEVRQRQVSGILIGASEGRGTERVHALVFIQRSGLASDNTASCGYVVGTNATSYLPFSISDSERAVITGPKAGEDASRERIT